MRSWELKLLKARTSLWFLQSRSAKAMWARSSKTLPTFKSAFTKTQSLIVISNNQIFDCDHRILKFPVTLSVPLSHDGHELLHMGFILSDHNHHVFIT